ncbi:MAG TPA: hypothetical protein VKV04_17260, partial [Verrucomicrobiae bacterium]|nr:hypothetical protein [Verrucomicrobiae bacterium]
DHSKILAASSGEKIIPEFQRLFDAAIAGDVETVTNMYADFKQRHPQYERKKGIPSNIRLWNPAWEDVLDICMAYDHVANCNSKYTQIFVDDLFNSIPPGSIYFGGTDPGRGLPTAFSKSHVDADPFYTLTQNALANSAYLDYLRDTYGERRHWLSVLAEAHRTDSELQKSDGEFQNALDNEVSLMSEHPENDPRCEAADKTTEELRKKRNQRADELLAKTQAQMDPQKKAKFLSEPPQVIYIPNTEDSQKAFDDYAGDVQQRLAHDEKFPNEPHQAKPGESVTKGANGKPVVSGQIAVMGINGLISKVIFDKNPDREFYLEESFPLDWMFPYLEPHGLIMKINREPLAHLPEDVVQRDHDYWQKLVGGMIGNWLTDDTSVQTVTEFAERVYLHKDLNGFTGDPQFVQDSYAPKMFSKLRSSIGGVYSWRLGQPPSGGVMPAQYIAKDKTERARMEKAADFAFKQSFAICPYSPEAVYRYVQLLVNDHRVPDALLIAETASRIDPANGQFTYLIRNLKQMH